ncbi:hypothetical protein [Streptomyces sp. NPDC005799]|uniref:hypothetical protein n=1 Tax=Streptomyces sp. NPDC005799 TaxID=3154678 RepID=UPI0033D926D7
MARVRFIGPEPVTVPELGGREVQPDEVVDVPDERYWGYACQTANWEEIEPPVDFTPPGAEPPAEPPAAEPAPEQQVGELPPAQPAAAKTPAKKTAAKASQKES